MLAPWKKSYDQPSSIFKSRDISFETKVHLVKAMVFPVVMYGCESLAIKKAECQRIDAFCPFLYFNKTCVEENSWESLGLQEIQPVHPKGNQSWIFIGRTDAETETPIFWPPEVKSWLIWKDLDAGKDWRKSSVQFICSVVSDSLQHHGLQHARPPCPSPTPGVYPDSCPLSQWWLIQPSHPLSSPSPPAINLC